MALAAVTEFTFKEAEKLKEFLVDPSKFAALVAPVAAAAPAAAATAQPRLRSQKSPRMTTWDLVFSIKLFDQMFL